MATGHKPGNTASLKLSEQKVELLNYEVSFGKKYTTLVYGLA